MRKRIAKVAGFGNPESQENEDFGTTAKVKEVNLRFVKSCVETYGLGVPGNVHSTFISLTE